MEFHDGVSRQNQNEIIRNPKLGLDELTFHFPLTLYIQT
jgi:hypothetical protein